MGEEGEDKEEEVSFTTRMDARGRISVPPDVRENMGAYGKAAQVAIKMKILRFYETAKEGQCSLI